MWPLPAPTRPTAPATRAGVIGFDRGLSLNEIVDGTSNTIMVAEVSDGGPWFAGGNATARRIDDLIEKREWSSHPGGGNFLFADASVRYLSSTIDPQTLRHLATAQGLERIEQEYADGEIAAAKGPATAPAAASPAPAAKPESSLKAAEENVAEEKKAEEVKRPAHPPATKPAKPSPQVSPPPRPAGGERASLSLGVALETRGGQAIRFRHEGGAGELVLGLQDRAFAETLQWLFVAAALLAAWMWRRMPGSRRASAVVLGLAVPIGLSGLVPLAWTPLLDGVLLGAVAAGSLWILLRIMGAVKMSWLRPTVAALVIGFGLSFAGNLGMAAEETAAAAGKPAAAGQAGPPNLTLFIPYDPDHDKPLQNTQVYLPHDEFLRLWKQAHPGQPDHAAPSVRAMVSYAEYSGRLENDVAHFDGRLLIHHLVEGWTRVALPLGKVALEKIEINGRPATLADDVPADRQQDAAPAANAAASSAPRILPPAGDQPAIYLDKPGPHVVDVRFSVPVSRLGATGQMTVPLRPVSAGRLSFQLPAEGLDVQVSGAPGGWRRQSPVAEDKGTPQSTPAQHADDKARHGAVAGARR